MKTVLFNLHDLVLVAIIGICGLLAFICAIGKGRQPKPWPLFGFLIFNGMVALDTLLFWGEGVKHTAFGLAPWSLTFFSFASFTMGPVFYWFIRSELTGNKKLHWKYLIHLVPALLTPIYLYWVCYRYPVEVQHDLVLNLGLYSFSGAHFTTFITFKELLPAVYCLYCLSYFSSNQPNGSHSSSFNVKHLFYFALGFSFIRVWILITHLLGDWLPLIATDYMGILGNYMTLALLSSFAFSAFRPSSIYPNAKIDPISAPLEQDGQSNHNENIETSDQYGEVEAIATSIQTYMDQSKPYLNPRLTLERFAEQLDIPTRQVSNAINRVFQQNIQEYINHHRIEEAKRLLATPDGEGLTITEIAKMSGFNSKATFNRLFKGLTSLSPSQYREMHQLNFSPHYSSD